MAVTLKIENYSSMNIKEVAQLNADAAVGSTTLTLVNNNNIGQNDYLLLANPGAETGEIVLINSASGATLVTSAATTLPHYQFNTATALYGNQIKIYRAPNVSNLQPDDSTFVYLATVNIDPDQLQTSYTDSAGSSAYWYKSTYYNQTSTAETNIADSASARGAIGNYCSIMDIRSNSGLRSRYISDALVDTWRKAAQAEVNGALNGRFTVPFVAPVNGFIVGITIRLAAGYLMMDQYDQFTDLYAEGAKKVADAQASLQKLQDGTMGLAGDDGSSLANTDSGDFNIWPNGDTQTTSYDQGGDDGAMFRVSDVLHGSSRKY